MSYRTKNHARFQLGGHPLPRLETLEVRETPALIGALDPAFGSGGQATFSQQGGSFQTVVADPHGGLIAVGSTTNTDSMLVARFLPNGSLDAAFGTNGFVVIDPSTGQDEATAVTVLSDGTILAAGWVGHGTGGIPDAVLVKLSADGKTVTTRTYDLGGGSDNRAYAVAANPNTGDIYLGGYTAVGGSDQASVIRVNSNLNFVSSNNVLGTSPNQAVQGIAVAQNGQVYTVETDGSGHHSITRFNANLSSPATSSLSFDAYGIAVGSQGQIYVGGMTSGNSQVIELNSSLGVVQSRTVNIGSTGLLNNLVVDSLGRIVVSGGKFRPGFAFAGTPTVARLLPADLSPDPSFNGNGIATLSGNQAVLGNGVAVDSEGGIVVVGMDNSYTNPSAARFTGSVGVPYSLLATGPTNGTGLAYAITIDGSGQLGTPGAQTKELMPGFGGELRVAMGDVNGDGVPDAIIGSGPGGGRVRVIDSKTGAVLADFQPYGASFTGGVFVAAGDLNGDGRAEVIVTPDAPNQDGPGALVLVYEASSLVNGTNSPTLLAKFLGIADLAGQADTSFKGGARAAVGDVDGDGRPDLLISAGQGGGPRITIWPGTGFANANGGQPTVNPIANLFVFESSQRGGAFVTAGDLTGDGKADIIVGGGPGGGPRVRTVDAAKLLALPNLQGVNLDDPANLASGLVLNNFFVAGDANSRGGVRVSARDLDGDNRVELVVASGTGLPSSIRVYKGTALAGVFGQNGAEPQAQTIDPFSATIPGGVWIG